MLVVRPFRAVRPAKDRVDPAVLVADAGAGADDVAAGVARDPRHLGQLLAPTSMREAAFAVQDMLRAGVLVRDRAPSLTIVRSHADDDPAATCVIGALRDGDLDVAASADPLGVVVAPIVVTFADKKGRIARVIDNETEREPDAAFVLEAGPRRTTVEVWVVDDDSAAARLASLLENAEPAAAPSASWQLGCFVDVDEPRGLVPVGICLLPTTNAV